MNNAFCIASYPTTALSRAYYRASAAMQALFVGFFFYGFTAFYFYGKSAGGC